MDANGRELKKKSGSDREEQMGRIPIRPGIWRFGSSDAASLK